MIILKETGNRRNNIIKAIYSKPMAIVLNAKENKAFTLKLGMQCFFLTTFNQYNVQTLKPKK